MYQNIHCGLMSNVALSFKSIISMTDNGQLFSSVPQLTKIFSLISSEFQDITLTKDHITNKQLHAF